MFRSNLILTRARPEATAKRIDRVSQFYAVAHAKAIMTTDLPQQIEGPRSLGSAVQSKMLLCEVASPFATKHESAIVPTTYDL